MKHHSKYILGLKLQNRIFWTLFISAMVGVLLYITQDRVVSPCSDSGCTVLVKTVYAEDTLSDYQKIDLWVDEDCNRFFNGKSQYYINRCKALTHYLLLREQNYGGSNNCGDSGKACGPMQFHEPTYKANRTAMIKKGLTKEMKSRLDMESAIETAIYMFSIGQEKQWGPVARGEITL